MLFRSNADVTVEAPAETESTEGTESAEPQEAVDAAETETAN